MVDLAVINTEAKQVQFSRFVLTLLAGVLYGIGWTARKILAALWFAAAWSWTAVRLGWQEAKPHPKT